MSIPFTPIAIDFRGYQICSDSTRLPLQSELQILVPLLTDLNFIVTVAIKFKICGNKFIAISQKFPCCVLTIPPPVGNITNEDFSIPTYLQGPKDALRTFIYVVPSSYTSILSYFSVSTQGKEEGHEA